MAFKRLSAKSQRAITRGKIRKLQRAGLLSDKINASKKPNAFVKAKLYKYRRVLSGKDAAVKVSTTEKAEDYRRRIGAGGQGKTVIIPREKGERFSVTKKDEIKSTRTARGEKIHKSIGTKLRKPKPGEQLYYTIPKRTRGAGELKRRTFASYDEFEFYLDKYEIDFADLQDYIEVERRSPAVREKYLDERGRAYRYKKRQSRRGPRRHRGR